MVEVEAANRIGLLDQGVQRLDQQPGSQPAEGQAQQQGGQGDQCALPADPVGVRQEFVFRHQQGQLQALGAAFGELRTGDYPLPVRAAQVVVGAAARSHEAPQDRAQVLDPGQACVAAVADQPGVVGVGHGIVVFIEQDDFGRRGDLVFVQGRGQVGEGQVGGDHHVRAAAPGEGGADIVGGEKQVGRGGDLVAVLQGAVEPGAYAGIVGFAVIVLAADQLQGRVVEQ